MASSASASDLTGDAPLSTWRVFPWDPAAADGEPFSARFVPAAQGSGRFDTGTAPVLYLAESPAHAVGEVLQAFRGRPLRPAHLRRFGRALAVVEVTLPGAVAASLADLTDPAVLTRHRIRPDTLASHDVRRTQETARALHAADLPGFRWWSSLSGDWHTVILFLDRIPVAGLGFGAARALASTDAAVTAAAQALGIRV